MTDTLPAWLASVAPFGDDAADALYRRILCEPGNYFLRELIADRLEEVGGAWCERAEFIRLQIKMATCRMYHRKDGTERKDSYAANCGRCVPGRLRERELRIEHWDEWTKPLQKVLGLQGWEIQDLDGKTDGLGVVVGFRRGFPGRVTMTLAAFMGAECHRCEGQGDYHSEEQRRQRINPDLLVTCCVCNGTGRTPGLAATLAKTVPLEGVRLTCRVPEPNDGSGECLWSRGYDPTAHPDTWGNLPQHDPARMSHMLPVRLFNLLPQPVRPDGGEWVKLYSCPNDANTALSLAAVAFARQQAGLPEMEGP